jgi:hypothetical protein
MYLQNKLALISTYCCICVTHEVWVHSTSPSQLASFAPGREPGSGAHGGLLGALACSLEADQELQMAQCHGVHEGLALFPETSKQ